MTIVKREANATLASGVCDVAQARSDRGAFAFASLIRERLHACLQVGFYKQKEVRKCKVEKKKNDLLNRINKTKREAEPDLAAERERYDKEISHVKRQEVQVCMQSSCSG